MEYQGFFSEVKDLWVQGRLLHLSEDTLMLSLCTMICEAEDFEDIETMISRRRGFLPYFLELVNGKPPHDNIDRVSSF